MPPLAIHHDGRGDANVLQARERILQSIHGETNKSFGASCSLCLASSCACSSSAWLHGPPITADIDNEVRSKSTCTSSHSSSRLEIS